MSDALTARLQLTRRRALKPSPSLSLPEWSDTYRFLSPESSSAPGRFKTSDVEAARGPMLAVTDPTVKKISIMACTQLMKTEIINNIVAYFVHQDPSPIIVMQPTVSLAKTWSKDRLAPMIRDTPVLTELIKTKKSRDSGNTLQHKSFPGGHITVIGSNSPSELASRPVRITLRDEIDKYEDNIEGDPSTLIVERAATFWNSLDVGVCSPTIKGRSKIEDEWLASDRRKFHVDCPHCGHNHFMEFKHVKWQDNNPLTAQYQCPECTALWSEKERLLAIKSGAYVATAPFKGHAGFLVNKMASPWKPLSDLVEKFILAKNDPVKLKTFLNTQLAETWEEKGEAPEHMRLYERRALYPINSCPEGVGFLTAGCDVQKDRLEVEIVGWGRGKQSWSIDYRVIMGETSTEAPWKELDELMNETWELVNGSEVKLKVLAVDTGFNTQYVYDWARKYVGTNRVMPVKGSATQQSLFGAGTKVDVTHNNTKVRRGITLFPVGVDTAKSELYGWLNLKGAGDDGIYPPGYCFFPQYDEHYFKMLTAEQIMKTKNKKGQTVYEWRKTFERNEALDCRVYARAAAAFAGMDRMKNAEWDIVLGLQVYRPKPENPPKIQASNAAPNAYMRDENSRTKPNSYWGSTKPKVWGR